MVFTAVSAFVMLGIDTQLNRSNVINKYEKLLNSYRQIPKSTDKDEILANHVDMHVFLSMLSLNNNFYCSVQNHAKELYDEVHGFNMDSFAENITNVASRRGENYAVLKENYVNMMGKLGGLLIVLLTNKKVD